MVELFFCDAGCSASRLRPNLFRRSPCGSPAARSVTHAPCFDCGRPNWRKLGARFAAHRASESAFVELLSRFCSGESVAAKTRWRVTSLLSLEVASEPVAFGVEPGRPEGPGAPSCPYALAHG